MKIKIGFPFFEGIRNKFAVLFYVSWWNYQENIEYFEKICVSYYDVDSLEDSEIVGKLHEFCGWLVENSYIVSEDDSIPPYFEEFKDIFNETETDLDNLHFESYEIVYFNNEGVFNYIFDENGNKV